MEHSVEENNHHANTASRNCASPRQTLRQGCIQSLFRLIGPSRPFFGGHTIAEAGGSLFLPTTVFLIYRLLCTCGFVFTLVLFTATGDFRFVQYGVWVYLGAGLAMSCATFSSLCFLLFPELPSVQGARHSFAFLVNITVPIYQIFLTLTIAGDILYWSFLREQRTTPPHLLLYVVSAVVMLLDFVAARVSFRFSYAVLGEVLPILWLVFAWIRFAVLRSRMYNGLDPNVVGGARIAFFHTMHLIAPLIFGLILLFANRINPIAYLTARIHSKPVENETSSMSANDDLEVVRYANSYPNLAAATTNSAEFISLSAPLPMYQPSRVSAESYVRCRFWYPSEL